MTPIEQANKLVEKDLYLSLRVARHIVENAIERYKFEIDRVDNIMHYTDCDHTFNKYDTLRDDCKFQLNALECALDDLDLVRQISEELEL
jgi:hypothetical protein